MKFSRESTGVYIIISDTFMRLISGPSKNGPEALISRQRVWRHTQMSKFFQFPHFGEAFVLLVLLRISSRSRPIAGVLSDFHRYVDFLAQQCWFQSRSLSNLNRWIDRVIFPWWYGLSDTFTALLNCSLVTSTFFQFCNLFLNGAVPLILLLNF